MFMIGSDPELFLEDANGKVISAIGKIGGTKKRPKPVKALGKGFAIQEDNVLLEYNTPAAKSYAAWNSYHKDMLAYLTQMVGDMGLLLSKRFVELHGGRIWAEGLPHSEGSETADGNAFILVLPRRP